MHNAKKSSPSSKHASPALAAGPLHELADRLAEQIERERQFHGQDAATVMFVIHGMLRDAIAQAAREPILGEDVETVATRLNRTPQAITAFCRFHGEDAGATKEGGRWQIDLRRFLKAWAKYPHGAPSAPPGGEASEEDSSTARAA